LNKPDPKKEIQDTVKTIMSAGQSAPVVMGEIREQKSFHSGPLPPPEILKKYNEAVPNGAERIMTMAEKEQKHVHTMESIAAILVTIGQFGGFIMCMAAIIGAIVLALYDKPLQGLVSLVSGLGLLLGGRLCWPPAIAAAGTGSRRSKAQELTPRLPVPLRFSVTLSQLHTVAQFHVWDCLRLYAFA